MFLPLHETMLLFTSMIRLKNMGLHMRLACLTGLTWLHIVRQKLLWWHGLARQISSLDERVGAGKEQEEGPCLPELPRPLPACGPALQPDQSSLLGDNAAAERAPRQR